MNISEAMLILKAEMVFHRTPCGRPITELAVETVKATIQDEKNHNQPVFNCRNCCIMVSSLLVPSGCPSCGYKGKSDSKA